MNSMDYQIIADDAIKVIKEGLEKTLETIKQRMTEEDEVLSQRELLKVINDFQRYCQWLPSDQKLYLQNIGEQLMDVARSKKLLP